MHKINYSAESQTSPLLTFVLIISFSFPTQIPIPVSWCEISCLSWACDQGSAVIFHTLSSCTLFFCPCSNRGFRIKEEIFRITSIWPSHVTPTTAGRVTPVIALIIPSTVWEAWWWLTLLQPEQTGLVTGKLCKRLHGDSVELTVSPQVSDF